MAISPVLLKTLGGLAAVSSVAIPGYIFRENIFGSSFGTRFDRELVKILQDNKRDIVFKVTKGDGTTDITNGFPDFASEGNSNVAKVLIKVSLENGNKDNIKAANDATINQDKTIENLKKLNVDANNPNGKDWTWECKIEFKKESSVSDVSNWSEKSKLVNENANSKGFFNILKENLTTNNNAKWRDLKIKFIKDCAKNRVEKKNKSIDEKQSLDTDNSLTSTKVFNLKKVSDQITVQEPEFKDWFKK